MIKGEMTGSPRPQEERRLHRRLSPRNVRVRLVSGEYDDLTSGVNFAKRLVNIGLGGMCIETTGRLRAGVKMSAEIRFDDFGGALRTQALLVWVDSVKEGAVETYLAGFRFVGPELTSTVREFLEGGRASMIATKRQMEYQDLKVQAEERKAQAGRKKWSAPKKTAAGILLLIFLYVASFGAFVTLGRTEAPSGIHFRSPKGIPEESLTTLYAPLTWTFRKAGLEITVDPR
jgi:hypothetical protein